MAESETRASAEFASRARAHAFFPWFVPLNFNTLLNAREDQKTREDIIPSLRTEYNCRINLPLSTL